MVKDFRDQLKDSPIRVICDNMEIYIDNSKSYKLKGGIPFPNLVWRDDLECFYSFRPNTELEQNQYPFEITCVPYEVIQYMEAYATATTTLEAADYCNAPEDTQKQIKEMVQAVTGKIPVNKFGTSKPIETLEK